MRLIYLCTLLIIGMVITNKALAGMNCSTSGASYTVALSEINISPDAMVGDVVATSGQITKRIDCHFYSGILWAYVKPSGGMQLTGLTIQQHTVQTSATNIKSDCAVIETGYPGLGVAWYNYNSRTQWWQCVTDNEGISRVLNANGTTDIIDEIYLVKTGPVDTGNFNFNMTFSFNEGTSNSASLPSGTFPSDSGMLYDIHLNGATVIEAPTCSANRYGGFHDRIFSLQNALDGATLSDESIYKIICNGYIENGTRLLVGLNSPSGGYSYNNEYFKLSDSSIGVKVFYKEGMSGTFSTISPADPYFSVIINSNEATVFFTYSPYISESSGDYPLSDSFDFNYTLSIGDG